jgi:hypothetical protein
VTADFFIKGIYEIESELVSEISTIAVDVNHNDLSTTEGRKVLTDKIMKELNEFLVEEGFNPDIHYAYILNYIIIYYVSVVEEGFNPDIHYAYIINYNII